MSAPVTTNTATIAAGAALSQAMYLGHGVLVGIQMPAAWDAANLSFQASADGITYQDVYDFQGAEVVVQAAAARFVTIDEFQGAPWIKVRSGTTGSHVNQTLDSALILIVQKLPMVMGG